MLMLAAGMPQSLPNLKIIIQIPLQGVGMSMFRRFRVFSVLCIFNIICIGITVLCTYICIGLCSSVSCLNVHLSAHNNQYVYNMLSMYTAYVCSSKYCDNCFMCIHNMYVVLFPRVSCLYVHLCEHSMYIGIYVLGMYVFHVFNVLG